MKDCFCTKMNCALACAGERFSSILLVIIRLLCGWGFIHAGFGKLINAANVIPFFESLGFPSFVVYLIGTVELVGGILLALGLFSRLVSFLLLCVMVGAYSTAHKVALFNIFGDFTTFTKEAPFLFLYSVLVIFSFGPGCLSLDFWRKNKCCAPAAGSGESCCGTDHSSGSSCCG